jgi:hypothetical protein
MSNLITNQNRAQKISPIEYEHGQPYMPSNGTEGEIFMFHWCHKCALDKFEEGGESCPILNKSLIGKQPLEWVETKDGPCCIAWKGKGEVVEWQESPGQLSLL